MQRDVQTEECSKFAASERRSPPKTKISRTVIKRDGRREPVTFDKITRRLERLSEDLNVDATLVTQKVASSMKNEMHVCEIDEEAADVAAVMAQYHPDYLELAGRILVSNLHKETPSKFSEAMNIIYNNRISRDKNNNTFHYFSRKFITVINKYDKLLDAEINHNADYTYDYFAISTLLRAYLLYIYDNSSTKKKRVIERPQYMLMRVAVFLNQTDIAAAIKTYRALSAKYYTHASPTLFNAWKRNAQLSSCFLLTMKEDSIDGIFDTLKQCAKISQSAGGIGLNVSEIRATGSVIRSSNGKSVGIMPMLKVFEDTARYVDQGGVRKGSFAIYLEPWHADVLSFIELRTHRLREQLVRNNDTNTGDPQGTANKKSKKNAEQNKAPDLYVALWVPDLFMKRVEQNEKWTLFCPDSSPGLTDVWGEEFEKLYTKYEEEGRGVDVMHARDLWRKILENQVESGTPYMLYKDACNAKSNQQHLGTHKLSNLCAEIIEYAAPDEVAVCNLGSIAVQMFANDENKTYDFQKLYEVAYLAAQNLDRVIDINYYPVPEARRSNMRHRPIGLGVQGLADVFCIMNYAFDSPEARQLNKDIFETIYYAALRASCDTAKITGPYETFKNSPASQGKLQFHLWGKNENDLSGRYNWKTLISDIKQHGLRNSLLTAAMPTASTSQILGSNECIEPFTRNIYTRRTLAGLFVRVNKYLVKVLEEYNLWTKEIIDKLIRDEGSVQNITELPEHVRHIYRTVYEIPTKSILEMSADRGIFIDQTQSLNMYMLNPDYAKLTSAHLYSWRLGLKTGLYYFRSKAAAEAVKFTIGNNNNNNNNDSKKDNKGTDLICTDEICTSCSG